MLALYQHPDNKKTAPKLVSSYQHIYPATKVDQSSRWVLEWPGLGGVVANLMTDIHTDAYQPATALIQCEKADIAIECELVPLVIFFARGLGAVHLVMLLARDEALFARHESSAPHHPLIFHHLLSSIAVPPRMTPD